MSKWARGILASAALLSLAASAVADPKVASLEPPKSGGIGVDYTISFWSIPFGHTTFDARFTNATYRTDSHFETSGVVSAFWGATIDASSNGQVAEHGLTPATYDSFYRRGDSKKERVKVTFNGSGVPSTQADPPYNTKRFPVTDEQKKDTFDPLSAVSVMLAGLKEDPAKPCSSVIPVFDGRRRYNIELTYLHDEPVKLENGLYNGKAHLCEVHYNQIAGFKPKILKEGKSFPPIYAWFAEIPSASAPTGHYVIALKVWAPMTLGTVVVTLDKLQVQGGATKG
ncbi:MAG TPA: DUF3108 domain-containing protein [Rhizomicrobium sp.]|nr:DUF3108 domain-containing protein [Rhizomicrobium sp.]